MYSTFSDITSEKADDQQPGPSQQQQSVYDNPEVNGITVEALYDYKAAGPNELTFKQGKLQ